MPNWCNNTLQVSGEVETVERFKAEVIGERSFLSFEKHVPMPAELVNTESPTEERNAELITKYGHDNWYDWKIANWGTKWDAHDADLDISDTSSREGLLIYRFDTAWSPPVEWLKAVAVAFPTLRFTLKYEEEGEGFIGVAIGQNGIVQDRSISY